MFNSIFNVADQKEDNERLYHQPEQEVLHSNTVHFVYCCRKREKVTSPTCWFCTLVDQLHILLLIWKY